jgi:hypothetical protein
MNLWPELQQVKYNDPQNTARSSGGFHFCGCCSLPRNTHHFATAMDRILADTAIELLCYYLLGHIRGLVDEFQKIRPQHPACSIGRVVDTRHFTLSADDKSLVDGI